MDLLGLAQLVQQFKDVSEVPPNLRVVMEQALTGPLCKTSTISYQDFPTNIDFPHDPEVKTALRVGYTNSAGGQDMNATFVIGFDANNQPVKAVMYAGDKSLKGSGPATASFLEVVGVSSEAVLKMHENVQGNNGQGILDRSQCRSLEDVPLIAAIRSGLSASP